MDKEQALQAFWSRFGWTAWDENTVPDDAMEQTGGHYITYTVAVGEFETANALSASLWMRSRSWAEITAKSEEIYDRIGYGGRMMPYDGGRIWIRRGTPFAQRMGDTDDSIRRIYINIEAEYLSA